MDILIENLFESHNNLTIPGYFVRSTAPINVEDSQKLVDIDRPTIQDVVDRLYRHQTAGNQDTGLVIAIHGYNTGLADENSVDGVRKDWYQPLGAYVNYDDAWIKQNANRFVFLGYRWSSESLKQKNTQKDAFRALPFLLKVMLLGGVALTIVSLVLLIWLKAFFWLIPIILGAVGFSLVFCLYALRVSVYFRDSFRATNFGVTDLVELIRQLDQGLVERKIAETLPDRVLYERLISGMPDLERLDQSLLLASVHTIQQELSKRPDLLIRAEDARFQRFLNRLQQFPEIASVMDGPTSFHLIQRLLQVEGQAMQAAQEYWKHNPIKLSFIGHSMGGHVTTQTIRILSDVFDPRSIGKLGDQSEKLPSSRIGRVFCLGRLVLVSPDIPLLAITSGRSNFLRSSLRRFEEAYLFSSEGDLALRVASTAANYFSFPARTRTQGYRLGNVTIRRFGTANPPTQQDGIFGIVNLDKLNHVPVDHLLPYLEVNVLNQSRSQTLDPTAARHLNQESVTTTQADQDKESIADLFTYFDCTEYQDYADYNRKSSQAPNNVMILNQQRSPLRLLDYIRLFIAYATFSPRTFPRGRDVHGGYFWGKFSKLLLYRLAFLGFSGLLDSLLHTSPEELGIQPPPPDLEAELTQIRTLASKPAAMTAAQQETMRCVALQYLSWICQQKHIQVAVSPERYHVDVSGHDRDEVRESMLMQEKHLH